MVVLDQRKSFSFVAAKACLTAGDRSGTNVKPDVRRLGGKFELGSVPTAVLDDR